ncbi:MAG: EFR1 family ferrodoxin [Thermodesulfobacteriota bacterium]
MKTRRHFLKLGMFSAVCAGLPPGCIWHPTHHVAARPPGSMKRALVLWFSQTGNTQRIGRLLSAVWRKQGVAVTEAEIRQFDPRHAAGYDLIAMGCPVNHYDAPGFVKTWLENLPPLQGIPVAAFVTHGLPPSNQHNTGCAVLEIMAAKGGLPVGLGTFGNLGTYPPFWAFFPEDVLKTAGFPNEATYDQARRFAMDLITRVNAGEGFEFSREVSFGDVKKNLAPIWFSKLITDEHRIDPDRCQHCGVCREVCPTGAIDPEKGTVDKGNCVDCMGCINNCPARAVRMVYWGKELVGYPDFLRQQGIVVKEPEEITAAEGEKGTAVFDRKKER